MSRKTAVFGVGRPKCGKRTHLWRISQDYNAPYMDTGASLRAIKEIVNNSPRQQKGVDYAFLEGFVEKIGGLSPDLLKPLVSGGQVDDQFVVRLVRAWIDIHRQSPAIFIDGTPRSRIQLGKIARYLKSTGFTRRTVWFSTPEAECLRRPNREGREDEDSHVIVRRMRDYDNNVAPLYGLMRLKTHLLDIDNSHREVDNVREEILGFLDLSTASDASTESERGGGGIGALQPA